MILYQKLRCIFSEFIATPCAGCDGDRARTQGLAAGNIARGIANHVDLGCRKFAPMFFFCASTSERSEPVTVLMIVRKRSEFEKVPDAVVFQLQLRAAGDIASEQRQPAVASR